MRLGTLFAKPLVAGVVGTGVLFGAGAAYAFGSSPGYELTVVMPSAPNLVPGGKVEVNGSDAGRVERLQVRDGQAMVTVGLRSQFAPLPAGTTARIDWKALLGERILVLEPGPASNPPLPSRGRVEASHRRVELDQVLAALDAPTRQRLQSLLDNASLTLKGSQGDINASLKTAGPALQALGEISRSVGQDGESLRNLVTRLQQVTDVTAQRRADVSSAVRDLNVAADRTATQRQALDQTLAQLPQTLLQARKTLDAVPGTVAAADPLLRDAAPVASRLRGTAQDLRPLLQDLRPAVQDLRPALGQLSTVLQGTPGLLDSTAAVLPAATQTLRGALPAVAFLRPYTPEIIGWMSNWGSASANYDAYGNYARIYVQAGAASVDESPKALGPALAASGAVRANPHRQPGALEGQPWADANGSPMR